MPDSNDRFYTTSQASKITGISENTLRKWEGRYQQLKPKRDRTSNRRRYTDEDIAIVRRIKELRKHEHYESKGAQRRLSQELHGEGAPKTNAEILRLIDTLEDEVHAIFRILERRDFDT